MALVGDSHASHWFPAIEQIADANGWRLITFVKASCVFVDLPIFSPLLKREYTECEAWRPLVVQRLIAEQPDLVIVSSDRWLPPVNKGDEDPTRQGEAMARLLRQIPGRVAILADTPAAGTDVPVCLSAHLERHHRLRNVEAGRVRSPAPGPRARSGEGCERDADRPVGRHLPGRSVPAGGPRDDRVSRRPPPHGDVRRVAGRHPRVAAADPALRQPAGSGPLWASARAGYDARRRWLLDPAGTAPARTWNTREPTDP